MEAAIQPLVKRCLHCDETFSVLKRHKKKTYCSSRCRGGAWARKHNTTPKTSICPLCGIEFQRTGRQKYCSVQCRANTWARKHGRERYYANREKNIELSKQWMRKNPERRKAYARAHYEANRGKYLANSKKAKRAVRRATPAWLTKQLHSEVAGIYQTAQQLGLHVDHIIPLQGENVCGLHVPWNLQPIPAAVNRQKSNRHAA